MSSLPTPRIAVVGSLNIDLTYQVEAFPRPGETIHGLGTEIHFGGKGANQALAARRAGAEVEMIGCAGSDDHGDNYRKFLSEAGIGISGIARIDSHPTGSALILTERSGQNVIVVEAGANGQLRPDMIEAQAGRIAGADVLLLQLECPLDTVRKAAEIAAANQTQIVLNPSPWQDAFLSAEIPYDHLILNETEASYYFQSTDFSALTPKGSATILITRGAESTLYFAGEVARGEVASYPVKPVDTVGAGDSFAGAYALALAEGQPLQDAIAFANSAGALATLQPGAQSAIPTRSTITEFLSQNQSS